MKKDSFLRALRRPDRDAFDELLDACRSNASEGSNATSPVVFEPMLISMMLAHQKSQQIEYKLIRFIIDCARRYDKVIFMKIVDKIVLTHLLVRDMDKAKAFYTDVLGFEATQDTEWGEGNRGVFVVPPGGGTYIALDFIPGKKEFDTARTFILSTKYVEAAYNAIKVRGVKLNSEIMPYPPGGRFFSVNDPDGNVWNILQS